MLEVGIGQAAYLRPPVLSSVSKHRNCPEGPWSSLRHSEFKEGLQVLLASLFFWLPIPLVELHPLLDQHHPPASPDSGPPPRPGPVSQVWVEDGHLLSGCARKGVKGTDSGIATDQL